MSEIHDAFSARLWTSGGFSEDAWRHAETLPAGETRFRVILPLESFLALDAATLRERAGAIGVKLEPGEALESIAGRLGDIALVALVFPAFTDGRSFSRAALLRGRYGYTGPVRAVGDVLIDQVRLMLRSGFTELEVSNATTIARLGEGRVGGIDQHYQPAAVDTAKAGSYSWRRSSAA